MAMMVSSRSSKKRRSTENARQKCSQDGDKPFLNDTRTKEASTSEESTLTSPMRSPSVDSTLSQSPPSRLNAPKAFILRVLRAKLLQKIPSPFSSACCIPEAEASAPVGDLTTCSSDSSAVIGTSPLPRPSSLSPPVEGSAAFISKQLHDALKPAASIDNLTGGVPLNSPRKEKRKRDGSEAASDSSCERENTCLRLESKGEDVPVRVPRLSDLTRLIDSYTNDRIPPSAPESSCVGSSTDISASPMHGAFNSDAKGSTNTKPPCSYTVLRTNVAAKSKPPPRPKAPKIIPDGSQPLPVYPSPTLFRLSTPPPSVTLDETANLGQIESQSVDKLSYAVHTTKSPAKTASPRKQNKRTERSNFVFDTSSLIAADFSVLNLIIEKNNVCIPYMTLHEVDRLSKNLYADPSNRDRIDMKEQQRNNLQNQALRLRQWILSRQAESSNCIVRLQKKSECIEAYHRNKKSNDDEILGFAVYLQATSTAPVYFVSEDKVLASKAIAELGVSQTSTYAQLKRKLGVVW